MQPTATPNIAILDRDLARVLKPHERAEIPRSLPAAGIPKDEPVGLMSFDDGCSDTNPVAIAPNVTRKSY